MSFSYLFDPNKQFQDRNGVNNVGGFLRVYIDGTDDRATTYKDFNGTLNEADIMLDTDGRAVVIVDDSFTFRIEVYERDGALQWTVTQFTARGEGGGGGSSTPVVVDGTANEIDVTESMTAGVKYYTIGLATVVKNTLLGLLASLSNLVVILNSKADKVQGATAGNLAALDASGNLTDSGSKVADFKTKQTPVASPDPSGNSGLNFIDSVSQNENGEVVLHKNTVQSASTTYKGVVKLSNAIDSTSVTEAATPKAVKDAYDALNNKIVARAVFLSQAEWAVQSQLPGDPAKVYYVENGTGEDAYTVYVWKESTSTYEEVDESSIDLDGYWHDIPTTTGSGNVVTDITLGNDGVPQVTKGLTALTQHQSVTDNDPTLAWGTRSKVGTIGGTDLHVTMPSNPASGKLDSTGDASNTTSTFTKASGDTSSMTSGSKLSAIFTAISSFFASLKALAFKDKASYNDLSSGVQSSLDKADTAYQKPSGGIPDSDIASASTWNGKQGSLGISASGDTGKFLNERGAFVTPNYPSVPSVINSLTSSSTTDALSAAQGKALNDGKQNSLPTTGVPSDTYAINVSGSALRSRTMFEGGSNVNGNTVYSFGVQNTNNALSGWRTIAVIRNDSGDYSFSSARLIGRIYSSGGNWGQFTEFEIRFQVICDYNSSLYRICHTPSSNVKNLLRLVEVSARGTYELQVQPQGINAYSNFYVYAYTDNENKVNIEWKDNLNTVGSAGTVLDNYEIDMRMFKLANGQVGSPTTPVYVDANGQVQVCDTSQMGVGAASYAESVNLSRTLNSTYGDSIQVGSGTAVTISNSGNAKKWDSWRIAVDEFGTSSDTIYFY